MEGPLRSYNIGQEAISFSRSKHIRGAKINAVNILGKPCIDYSLIK